MTRPPENKPTSRSVPPLLKCVRGVGATILGVILLTRIPFVSQKEAGWYLLPGVPLVGVGIAVCLAGVSPRRAVRILASLIVTGSGLVLALVGAADRLLDPDDPWHMYNDPRPLSVAAGLIVACVGIAWCREAYKRQF